MSTTPILMLGAGRMGGAILDGWSLAGAFAPADVMILDPTPGDAALAAQAEGAVLNPPLSEIGEARTVVLSVKPQVWREVVQQYVEHLSPEAVVVSVAAGVLTRDIAHVFGGRKVARVMPTTAAAIGQGTASIYAEDPDARARAHALFDPIGTVVDLSEEGLLHAATAVSGSAPAYLYAFIEALEGAGAAQGLTPEESSRLARATIIGSAALLDRTGGEPAELRRQVTSPGGTTEAALNVLLGEKGLPSLLREAMNAAVKRSKELG